MKSIVIHAAKDLRIEEQSSGNTGAGQVKVRLAAGGICGSDLHYYNHGGFGAIKLKQPMTLGHEVAGHVEKIGANVTGLAAGDLVAVSPSRPCGDCVYCREELPNHCENMRFYGSAMPFPHIQGAFRQKLVVDASQCHVANGMTTGEAALAEPLSVVLHALKRAGSLKGKQVLVTGCGPIGTLSIAALKHAGADRIVAVDLDDSALDHAKAMGADTVYNTLQQPDALVKYREGKGRFDALLECSGAAPALAAGLATMRPRGVVMQLGLGGDMPVPMMLITAKELDLRGSFRFHGEFATAVELMRSGALDLKSLITSTLPMTDAVEAFELASDRSRSMKVQLDFS